MFVQGGIKESKLGLVAAYVNLHAHHRSAVAAWLGPQLPFQKSALVFIPVSIYNMGSSTEKSCNGRSANSLRSTCNKTTTLVSDDVLRPLSGIRIAYQ
jgi:hypothetical protein